jgi:hypothetical protein
MFVAAHSELRKSKIRFALIIHDPLVHIGDADKRVVTGALKLVKIETVWDTLE